MRFFASLSLRRLVRSLPNSCGNATISGFALPLGVSIDSKTLAATTKLAKDTSSSLVYQQYQ
jgi:hypothetical protein